MAVYTFNRGKFGMWGVPMWAGETQAFKLIKLLRKQGIKKILYEEGPLFPYDLTDHIKCRKSAYHNDAWLRPYREEPERKTESEAPQWFMVVFKEPR